MKKILITLFLGICTFFPISTFALDLGTGYTKNAATQAGFDTNNTDEFTLSENIGMVIKAALSMIGTIFLVLTVYAGFLWMTANGEESKIEKAQDILRAAVIGMVITLGSYGITAFVVDRVIQQTTAPSSAQQ